MGRKFELRINQYGMKHLFSQPTLNVRKTRWREFLSDYEFKIKHIKGKENQVADALNKRVHEVHIVSIIMYKTDLKEKFLEKGKLDQCYL
jgi:uncharacterized HAD superfamily protein